MKTPKVLGLLFLVLVAFAACKKKDVLGDVTVSVDYWADLKPIALDTMQYENAAGNRYSVTHLEYYISNFTLHSADVEPFAFQDIVLFDIDAHTTMTLPDVPIGTYNSVSLTIGLDNAHNTTGSLPNTMANAAMAWPDLMGGGYHFMKFEGYYTDSLGAQEGFAIHLGKSGNHVNCTIPLDLVVDEEGGSVALHMNLNEWFRNPHTYDFNVDGSSIMTNEAALQKISQNGVDVFD